MDYSGLFSSASDNWETPYSFFEYFDSIYHFNLDVCADHNNYKCKNYYTIADDGLSKDWFGTVWMNPPYGRCISKWIEKAYKSSLNGSTVVCLLPCRTDTKWFHEFCIKGHIIFIKGRLKFGNSLHYAPFPSMVVIFKNGLSGFSTLDVKRTLERGY